MAGNSSIWRVTTSSGTEGQAQTGELLEFNEGAVPTSKGHISTTEMEYDAEPAENEKAVGKINELQDQEISRITVVITGSIQTPSETDITDIVKKWMIESKVDTTFTKGLFGLRLNDNPMNNLSPTSDADPEGTRGYILSNFKLVRPVEFVGKLDFIATLRFNGDPVKNTPGDYDW